MRPPEPATLSSHTNLSFLTGQMSQMDFFTELVEDAVKGNSRGKFQDTIERAARSASVEDPRKFFRRTSLRDVLTKVLRGLSQVGDLESAQQYPGQERKPCSRVCGEQCRGERTCHLFGSGPTRRR